MDKRYRVFSFLLMKKYLGDADAEGLLDEARAACGNSYSPYSHFAVGAAVLTKDGRIFTGTNVENASYGLTICAERVAICNAVAQGQNDLAAIAVYTARGGAAPCGACRQFIVEFGDDIVVVFETGEGIVQQTIAELLPYAFTRNNLGR